MPTGTHFNYYMVCHRKLWLFANGINMEHTSDLVYEGKLIHEHSYGRRSEKYTEITLDGVKIDFYDARNKVVHETKKSDSHEDAHQWQVKYYIYILERNGITGVSGLLEYPRLHETHHVSLSPDDRQAISRMEAHIDQIIHADQCPGKLPANQCRQCSYFDYCWSGEE